jgi:hypothetical protein
MNNFMLHVPGLGVEVMNAIKPVAEIGSINFELYTIRTEKTGAELSAIIEPVLGPNPQYLLAGVDNFAYRGDGRLSSAAQMLRPVAFNKSAAKKDDGNPLGHREATPKDFEG